MKQRSSNCLAELEQFVAAMRMGGINRVTESGQSIDGPVQQGGAMTGIFKKLDSPCE